MLQSTTASLISADSGWEQQAPHTTGPSIGSRGDLAHSITVACNSQQWGWQGGVLTSASGGGSHTVRGWREQVYGPKGKQHSSPRDHTGSPVHTSWTGVCCWSEVANLHAWLLPWQAWGWSLFCFWELEQQKCCHIYLHNSALPLFLLPLLLTSVLFLYLSFSYSLFFLNVNFSFKLRSSVLWHHVVLQ